MELTDNIRKILGNARENIIISEATSRLNKSKFERPPDTTIWEMRLGELLAEELKDGPEECGVLAKLAK